MTSYVVIGFDVRGHIAVGKAFEDIDEANIYLKYLNKKMVGKMVGSENRHLEYAELFEMDYVTKK